MSFKNKRFHQQGTVNEIVTVRSTVELGEHVYDIYAEQAMKEGKDPEQVMAERLNRCKEQKDSGLFFNDQQKKRLCHCLGHSVGDAEGALQWLEIICKIHVEKTEIELEPRLRQRLSTRVPRGGTIEKLIEQAALKGLRVFAGMEPW
jgi:hypothetical protein